MFRTTAAVLLLALPLAAHQARPASSRVERPLPDRDAFLRDVRKHLQTDEQRQEGYSYVETRRQAQLDKNGNPQGESVKVFESYPGFPGERRWERLISEDGKPVPKAELEKQDRKRREEAEAFIRKQQKETDADRAKAAREREKTRREREAMVDDALRTFEVKILGREIVDGHETIAASFDPRSNVQTQTRLGGLLRHFRGRVWINEADYELVKVDAEALDDLSIGFGLLARLHKGSAMSFQRRQVDGQVWLPMKASYAASARVLLLRRMRIGGTSEFSNYKKFNVEATASYELPGPR